MQTFIHHKQQSIFLPLSFTLKAVQRKGKGTGRDEKLLTVCSQQVPVLSLLPSLVPSLIKLFCLLA